MTSMHTILAAPAVAAVRRFWPRRFAVRWTSLGGSSGSDRREFVLDIALESSDRATVAAWIDAASVRRIVLQPRDFAIRVCAAHGMLHVDVMGDRDGERIAAISLIDDERGATKPIYARSPLLAGAGFAAGAYDPPRLEPGGLPLTH